MKIDELRTTDTGIWADHFIEPHSGALYRQDHRGNWYDVEGVRLTIPVFLRGDVLVSLPGKVSRRSFAFGGQGLYISPRWCLIQVGKMVLNARLEPVRYFGDRLAGLGCGYIDLGEGDVWQEVIISLNRRGFLNEIDLRPLVINGEEIVAHAATEYLGGQRYDVFQSATRQYLVQGGADDLVLMNGQPAEVDFTTYVRFHQREVALARAPGEVEQYFDLVSRTPFRAPSLGDVPILALRIVNGPREDLFHVRTTDGQFVYDTRAADVYTVDGGELLPQTVSLHPDFPNDLIIVTVHDQTFICDRETQTSLAFGKRFTRINSITGKPGDRLLRATGVNGEAFILDTLAGVHSLKLAESEGQRVIALTGEPFRIGSRTLQACTVRQTGGAAPRILVVSHDDLPTFRLPPDLPAYEDREGVSNFAGNPVIEFVENGKVKVREHEFVTARFLTFSGSEENVLLHGTNGRPLQLDGDGHRKELATGFDHGSIPANYRLGEHSMVGVHTLTEDLKRGELMMSTINLSSWLSFYDTYLPILRRVVPFDASGNQSHFILYELRAAGGRGEYIAVEREAPHRILVQAIDGRYIPNIIRDKDRTLVNPEELSALRSFLTRAGTLVSF